MTENLQTFAQTLIQRCNNRNKRPLSPLKTQYPQRPKDQTSQNFSIYYASRDGRTCAASPADFENAQLGIMPIAKNGYPIEQYGKDAGKDWQSRYGFDDWELDTWKKSHGVQIYTGVPSNDLTDCDIEYQFIQDHPQSVAEMIQRLCQLTEHPLLTISKSGGLRFTCKTPGYIHPRTAEREYIAAYDLETGERIALYLEIFGEKGLSRWDGRYEIVTGSLFEIPEIDRHALFHIIDEYRDQHHAPKPQRQPKQSQQPQSRRTKTTDPYIEIDGLPQGIVWIPTDDGYKSQRGNYPCKVTQHRKSQGSAQYYQKPNGHITAYCHNCQQKWQVKAATTTKSLIEQARAGVVSPLAIPRKPIKLLTEKQHRVLTTLAKAQETIAALLQSAHRIIGLRADTGTGKNYEAETYAITNPTLVNVPTGELAIDLQNRAVKRFAEAGLPNERVFRRRGLMHRWKNGEDIARRFPHEVTCIQAPRADAYRHKGGHFQKVICPTCPELNTCEQYGYRSQESRAKEAQLVIMSDPDFHTNPQKRRYAQEYLTDQYNNPRFVVTDDISMSELFIACQITKERLQRMLQDWKDCILANFARKLLQLLEIDQDPYAIGEYLQTLTEKQKSHISYQLSHVRIAQTTAAGDTEYIVLRLDDAVSKGYYNTETPADIQRMPIVDNEKWTLLDQLQACFTRYKHSEDAPIRYHDGILTFVIPPKMHQQVTKAIFMSATLDEILFKRVYPHAHIENLTHTQLQAGAQIYQLRTNHNPRGTLYEYENQTPVRLSETGESYWKRIIADIHQNPDTAHAIITYKQVLDWKNNQIASELAELDNIVATAHFGNLVGLDTDFETAEVFHIFGSPEIPHHEIAWRAKMFYGNDDQPLDYTRDPETGKYNDPRLQRIWINAVIGELIQAIGRARLVRKDATVILWTSHYIEGITDREQTRLFDEADWDIADGLQKLADAVSTREAYETRARELTAENTIADFQAVHGCSQRHARRLWEEAGGKQQTQDNTAELRKQAQSLQEQGLSLNKIAARLKVSWHKVKQLLK